MIKPPLNSRGAKHSNWLIQFVVFGLFVVLPMLAFPEILFGRQTLWYSDITRIHYPYRILVAEEWLAGRVPLWNPYQHIGIPLLAEGQVGPLYPLGLLFLGPLPPTLELSIFIVLHFTLAASFTFLLARSLGLWLAPATIAGLSFGLGGFLMAQATNLNIMTGAVWLPLILASAIMAVRRGSVLLALLAGIPLALQTYTAQPQVVVYTLIILVSYVIYQLIADIWDHVKGGEQRPFRALLVIIAIVSGLLLSAPQLLPTYELQQHSVRARTMGFDFLTKNSWPPVMALNLIMPSAFGNNVVGFKVGDPFQEDFIYVGFIPLMLTLFAWSQHRKREMPFFLLLLVAGTLLALGRYTPLYQYIVQYLPGLMFFRIPSRWLMVLNLALAVMAGYGLQSQLERGLSRSQLIASLMGLLAVGLILALTWSLRYQLDEWKNSWGSESERKLIGIFLERAFIPHPIYQDRILLRWLLPLTAPAILLAFNLLSACVLLFLYGTRRISSRVFVCAIIVAVSVDLVASGGTTINPIRPDNWWNQLSGGARYVLEHLHDGRVWPLGMGREEAAVRNLGQYFPSAYRVRSASGHGSPLTLARYDTFVHTAHPVQQVQLLGVRYVLTEGRMGQDMESTYPLVYHDEQSVVYENRKWLPRAFVVHEVVRATSGEEALRHFKSLDLDIQRAVVIEAPPDTPLPTPTRSSEPDLVLMTRDEPDVVEIQVTLASDGYLILLDTWYPGWQATVDDVATPIYRANYLVRAIFVPAGTHTVRFEYRPYTFLVGLQLAALAMLAIVGAAMVTLLKRTRLRVSSR